MYLVHVYIYIHMIYDRCIRLHLCTWTYFINEFASCGTLQNPRRPESSGKKLLLPMCGPCVQQILGKRCGIHGFQLLEFSQAPQDTVFWLACKQNVMKLQVPSGPLAWPNLSTDGIALTCCRLENHDDNAEVSSIASSEELIFEDLLRCWPKAVADAQ